jgi:uncharacterized protein YlzI (FlbEa/FlbD family)
LRTYKYDGDVLCRLCGRGDESVDHIVNNCEMIPRTDIVADVFSLVREDVETVVSRVKTFVKLLDEMEKDKLLESC